MKFIDKRDKEKTFTIISRDEPLAIRAIHKHTLTQDSIFYIRDSEAFVYSQAVLEIMKDLGGLYKVLYILKVFPKSLGDFFYKLIAKHRYKLFGKKRTCSIDRPSVKK